MYNPHHLHRPSLAAVPAACTSVALALEQLVDRFTCITCPDGDIPNLVALQRDGQVTACALGMKEAAFAACGLAAASRAEAVGLAAFAWAADEVASTPAHEAALVPPSMHPARYESAAIFVASAEAWLVGSALVERQPKATPSVVAPFDYSLHTLDDAHGKLADIIHRFGLAKGLSS